MNPLEEATPEDLLRIRDETLPDHISISDDGTSMFAWCDRCNGIFGIYARRDEQEKQIGAFVKEHTDCPGSPQYDKDELRDDEPYFESDEDRCPHMGFQGAVFK